LGQDPIARSRLPAGHRELRPRPRPFDASRDFLTDLPLIDERLDEPVEIVVYNPVWQAGFADA
jgi:hypothetical protein